ncbi:MAG: hypothetical protein LBL07_20490 [Tannerella sp.]|nr:hypothetical protein [Tannerella sp.]
MLYTRINRIKIFNSCEDFLGLFNRSAELCIYGYVSNPGGQQVPAVGGKCLLSRNDSPPVAGGVCFRATTSCRRQEVFVSRTMTPCCRREVFAAAQRVPADSRRCLLPRNDFLPAAGSVRQPNNNSPPAGGTFLTVNNQL